MTTDRIPREFRDATPDDEAFIFSAWLRSHHENGDWPHRTAGCCNYSHRRYFDAHKHVVRALVRDCKTIIACSPARPSQILGFITFEEKPGPIHWVDVKKLYRRNGIATDLLMRAGTSSGDALPRSCSHWSVAAEHMRNVGWPLRFDPFLIGEPQK